LGGWITSHLQGRVIEMLMIDGIWLIVRCTDGSEAKIGWQDKSGNQLKGEPFLENMDVRFAISGASLTEALSGSVVTDPRSRFHKG